MPNFINDKFSLFLKKALTSKILDNNNWSCNIYSLFLDTANRGTYIDPELIAKPTSKHLRPLEVGAYAVATLFIAPAEIQAQKGRNNSQPNIYDYVCVNGCRVKSVVDDESDDYVTILP